MPFVPKCEWLKYFPIKTQKHFILLPILLEIRVKLTFSYECIFTARSRDRKYNICIKYIYVKANIHLLWAGVYLHGGVYLQMWKLTFTYMQLRSHAEKFTRVQIIHICIIYISCVNKCKLTGLNIRIMKWDDICYCSWSVKSIFIVNAVRE